MKAEWTNRDSLSIESTSQNSKAILVIDMPNMCLNCDLYAFQSCFPLQRRIGRDGLKMVDKPEWCPLKSLPSKELDDDGSTEWEIYYQGWIDCLDKIMGETE